MAEQSMGWSLGKSTNNPSDQWLIKSANRVMGPFKLSEVVMGLELKHFTVMDEIATPFGRWTFIRDEQALQAAVKDIRNRVESVENTATLTHTMTTSKSYGTVDSFFDETQARNQGISQSKNAREGRPQERGRQKSSNLLLIGIVLLAVAGLGAYYSLKKTKVRDANQDLMAQALQLKSQGFYERSFAILNKLRATDKDNPQLELEVATYQIALQNQNAAGRKNIEKILGQFEGKENEAVAYTAMALSFINENEFKSATEAINKALTVDSNFIPALINRSIIDFKNGFPELAEQNFEPLMNQNNNGLVVLGSALASLEVNRKGIMPKRILPVLLQSIDEYLKNNYAFQQEAYVLKAYIYNILNKPDLRQEAVLELLTSDLESGQGHRIDILVDRSVLSWKNLLPYCQTAIELAPKDVLNRSLLAYCLTKAGSDLEAKKTILEVEAEAPRDPYVAAIKAFIMKSLGQDSESRASLGVALGGKAIQSAWLMKAKYCEVDRDDSCAQEALSQLLSINSKSITAHLGMARLESRRGNKRTAAEWITKGQALSATFLPFWEIKNTL